jgi:hypothetical protein
MFYEKFAEGLLEVPVRKMELKVIITVLLADL